MAVSTRRCVIYTKTCVKKNSKIIRFRKNKIIDYTGNCPHTHKWKHCIFILFCHLFYQPNDAHKNKSVEWFAYVWPGHWPCLHWREHHFGPSIVTVLIIHAFATVTSVCVCVCIENVNDWVTFSFHSLYVFPYQIYFSLLLLLITNTFISCATLKPNHSLYELKFFFFYWPDMWLQF